MTMTTEKRIEKLMEMLNSPEAYSEQDIRNIIADDKEVREFYQTMVEARQSYRKVQADSQPIDMDEAWQRFAASHLDEEKSSKARILSMFGHIRKTAAIIIGVLLMSGLSYAAIVQIQRRNEARQAEEIAMEAPKQATPISAATEEKTDTLKMEPKTFDNVPLSKMLPEIADHYGMKISFLSEEAKDLRLFFTWNPQESVDKTINKLNQFERLSIKREGENIIVE